MIILQKNLFFIYIYFLTFELISLNHFNMNSTLPRTSLKLFTSIMLGLLIYFNTAYVQAQTPSGISIFWDGQVGCQIYGDDYDIRDEKEPVFLEDIEESRCYRVCENSLTNLYLENVPNGNVVNWSVAGGEIMSSSNNNCQVEWGVNGMGSLTFQIISGSSVITKTLCFEKIIIPNAQFSIVPYNNQNGDSVNACVNQTIYFTNQSTTNNGSGLISYLWDFGDGTYSSAFEPSHAYLEEGTYTITLMVRNACNCVDNYRIRVRVGPKGFDIYCPSIVCEDQTAVYSLPFDGRQLCQGSYNWSVTGGTVENVNHANGDVTVIWDNVNPNGFGYVTFNPGFCNLDCYVPTTIKVPVILSEGTITGPNSLCVGSQGRYVMPQWPTTDFKWEVLGNEDDDLADVILTDQRNEVIVQPLVNQTLYLKVTYTNTLTGCSGIATFTIQVESPYEINGSFNLCQGTSTTYLSSGGSDTNWTLFDANENLIASQNNSETFTYTFNQPGNYVISTSGNSMCEGEQKVITVLATPNSVGLANVQGETIVCPNSPYNYTITNADPNATYSWSIQNGSLNGSNTGNQVSVTFNNTGPHSLTVVKQTINPIVCSSAPTVIPITLQQVPVYILSENNINTICANDYQDFFAYQIGTTNLYTEGETYQWSLSNTSAGSITSGQGTNAATVLWNNVQTATTVEVKLTIQKCTLPPQIFTYLVTINPTPVIEIGGINAICSGEQFVLTITSTNGVPLPPNSIVTWNSGAGNFTGGLSHTFQLFNTTSANIGRNITAVITNPSGCASATNTAQFNVTVYPSPPATLSITSGGNVYCEESEINTHLTIASSTTGLTIEWYKNNVLIPGANLPDYYPTTFGSYTFKVTNTQGCSRFSNDVTIVQICGTPAECEYTPLPEVFNNSYNDCGTIQLIGGTNQTPLSEYFNVIGPGGQFSGTQYNATAGLYHVFYTATYQCQNDPTLPPLAVRAQKDIVVPYIPKLLYEAECNGNQGFTITLFDETNYFSPVNNRQVAYFYRPLVSPVSNNQPITGNTLTGLAGGNYTFTITVQGDYDGVTQPPCSASINVFLATMPTMTLQITDPALCHDSAVGFIVLNSNFTDNFLWTFDEGATSTLQNPSRVFTTSGSHTVTVVITNRFGCTQTLQTQIIVPEKCFGGDVVASPNPPSVCAGSGVTLIYVPDVAQPNTSNVEQYVWMNGNNPILPEINNPTITVFEPGFYWVKLKSANDCEYNTPGRITPIFKPLPSITLSGEATLCYGEPLVVKATTNATTISWTINGVNQPQFNNNFNPVFTNYSLGVVTITATVTLNGCSSAATLTTVAQESPTDVTITAGVISCSPYTYKLTASSSSQNVLYNWSNGMLGESIYVYEGGPFQVTASVGNCSVSTQIDVPKDPEVYSWIFPEGCYNQCKEGTRTLIGPRVLLPYWGWIKEGVADLEGVETFPLPYTLPTNGEYAFTLNTGDCEFTTNTLSFQEIECDTCRLESVVQRETIRNETKYCSFTVYLEIASGTALQGVLSALSDNLVIAPSVVNIPVGITQLVITVVPLGNFTGGSIEVLLTGTDSDGNTCLYEFDLVLPPCVEEPITTRPAQSIASDQTDKEHVLAMFPNPTQNEVTIQYSGYESDVELNVFDLTGRLMSTEQLPVKSNNLLLNVTSYPTGIYIVVIKQGEKLLFQHKLIKN